LDTDTLSIAEICDRHRTLLAGAFLLLGGATAVEALGHFVHGHPVLVWIEIGGASGGALLIVGAMVWKSARLRGRRGPYLGGDGFVASTVSKAHVASWSATFVLVALLRILVDDETALPAEFFLQLVLAVMLLVHGAVFFVLNRSEPDDA